MCVCVLWLQPAIQSTTSPWSAVNLKKKTADLDKVYLEPSIWSRDTGQRIPCFGRCQLTITLMSNIKDVWCKLVTVSNGVLPPGRALNLSPWYGYVYWSHWHTWRGGRTYGRTLYVRTDVYDVMAIKPNFLTSMGYHIFLTMVLRARAPLTRAELR